MGMQADQCRIMVRVYANILGLSKVLARAGLVGHEARSLSSFTSAFNRAQDLFDFVDAAERKEGSDFKIRGELSRAELAAYVRANEYRWMKRCSDCLLISTNAVISTLRAAMTRASALY